MGACTVEPLNDWRPSTLPNRERFNNTRANQPKLHARSPSFAQVLQLIFHIAAVTTSQELNETLPPPSICLHDLSASVCPTSIGIAPGHHPAILPERREGTVGATDLLDVVQLRLEAARDVPTAPLVAKGDLGPRGPSTTSRRGEGARGARDLGGKPMNQVEETCEKNIVMT